MTLPAGARPGRGGARLGAAAKQPVAPAAALLALKAPPADPPVGSKSGRSPMGEGGLDAQGGLGELTWPR